MDLTKLAAGSLNTLIPDNDKIEPRAGMNYFGTTGTQGTQTNPYWTVVHRIHSKYDDFVNKNGLAFPIRVSYSGISSEGDVIEAWLPVYVAGVPTSTSKWYQVTATVPTIPLISTHRYYFAEWFDQTLNILQPELIFTYGATKIGNLSGGFAPITAVTPTTLKTANPDGSSLSWNQAGFISTPEGINTIIVNVSGVPTEMSVTGTTTQLFYDTLLGGPFQIGETITGSTSLATAVVV